MARYARTLEELKDKAVLYWPPDLLEKAESVSIFPLMLKTQDNFLGVLNAADGSPTNWKMVLEANEGGQLRGNLFLKHLMVLSDIGGEMLNKYPPLTKFFPSGEMIYFWRGSEYTYSFKKIQKKIPLTNTALKVDGKRLPKAYPLDEKMEDVVMLILHAASSVGDSLPDDFKSKCLIGSLIGNSEELKTFVKQSYIRISKQLAGATANALGQFAQSFIRDKLNEQLPTWRLFRDSSLPGVTHTDDNTETVFDIVAVSPKNRYFGIDVSFQVTTNAYIEGKAGKAKERAARVRAAGHYLCNVLDGAGNINVRERASRIICRYSDCTVAFSTDEIAVLAKFMKEKDKVR